MPSWIDPLAGSSYEQVPIAPLCCHVWLRLSNFALETPTVRVMTEDDRASWGVGDYLLYMTLGYIGHNGWAPLFGITVSSFPL